MRETQDGGMLINVPEILAMSEPASPTPNELNAMTFMEEVVHRITAGEAIIDMSESMDTPVSHIMAAYRTAMQAQLQCDDVRLRNPDVDVLCLIEKHGGRIIADEPETETRPDACVRVAVPAEWRYSGHEPIPFQGARYGDNLVLLIPTVDGTVAVVNREDAHGAQSTHALSPQLERYADIEDTRHEVSLQNEVKFWQCILEADAIRAGIREAHTEEAFEAVVEKTRAFAEKAGLLEK